MVFYNIIRSFYIWILLCLIIPAGLVYAQEKKVFLADLIEIALSRNPQIKKTKSLQKVEAAKVPQAGAWDDPNIVLGIANFPVSSFSFSDEPMTGKQIQIQQRIPFPGIKNLGKNIAQQSELIAGYVHEETINRMLTELKIAYYNLFAVDKSITILKQNKTFVWDVTKIAEIKYATGKGIQQDVLKAQVELSKIMELLVRWKQKRKSMAAKINMLLNRDMQTPINELAEVHEVSFGYSVDSIMIMGVQNRPLLKEMEMRINMAKLNNSLAKKEYWPNFNINLGYSQRKDRRDFLTGMFSVSLPIYAGKKQSQVVQQTALEIDASQENYTSLRNEIHYEMSDLYSGIRRDEELIALISEGIIPQASQSFRSALSGYQVDKVDFITLLDNLKTLYDYEIDYYRVLASYRNQIARMELLAGRQLIDSLQ